MSSLVTLDEARSHCKAYPADDAMLQIYLDAAELEAARLANRNIYPTQDALTTALGTISAAMVTAHATYAAAIAAADALDDENDQDFATAVAEANLRKAQVLNSNILDGIVVDANIKVAILFICAHNFANREEVVTGAGANATVVPMGAQRIMSHYRATGDL
jgi:hypothetical protein